jgi:hypothetical protein
MPTSHSPDYAPTESRYAQYLQWCRAMAEQRWNALVPNYARCVSQTPDGKSFKWLHPTKGWRFVSRKRLGLVNRSENLNAAS